MKPSKRSSTTTSKKTPPTPKTAVAVAPTARAEKPAVAKSVPTATKTAELPLKNQKPKSTPTSIAPKVEVKEAKPRKVQQQPTTMVAVKVNVGFGNSLFIRGQGLGLTWERGIPLNCVDSSTWVWAANQADSKAEFKVLINDEIWSKGENLSVAPGERIEVAPAF
jgi:hypothetical protein